MMRMLAGHPCAVQLHEVYEDDSCFYLVSAPAGSLGLPKRMQLV